MNRPPIQRSPLHPTAFAVRRRLLVVVCLLIAVACTGELFATSVPGESHVWLSPMPDRLPLVIGTEVGFVPAATLPSAVEAEAKQVDALFEHNRLGKLPIQNGFARTFDAVTVTLDDQTQTTESLAPFAGGMLVSRGGQLVWSTAIEVADAYAVRLHLEEVKLPADAAIFVGDASGRTFGPFGAELQGPDGDIWLPPVWGSTAVVEIQVGEASVRAGESLVFSLKEIVEIFEIGVNTKAWTDCDIDATCTDSGTLSMISDYYNAVAHLWFIDGSYAYICTGGLVNDTVGASWIPYLLTAHHCFSTQAPASSLTAYFDFKTSTCDGTPPFLGSVPQVSGSTLLATNASSDFTFVELSGNPSGTNYYLGWTPDAPAHGTTLHRVSHPDGTAQKYSAGSFNATGGIVCPGKDRPDFHYSSPTTGSTTGGSSGAPVIIDALGGQIVGQLLGTCHYTTWDDCNYGTYNWIDGAFGTTYSSISSWIDPELGLIFSDGFENGGFSEWSSHIP